MPNKYEVFARPLVKTVIFQVTFPNLFSIDAKIGEFQSTIMQQFPESSLLLKQHLMLVQRLDANKEFPEPAQTEQIWQFKNSSGVAVDVTRGSLSISSESHKTYSEKGSNPFREVIELVSDNFFKIVRIPLIYRIGLRYINNCPLSQKTTAHYRKYYKGALPLNRFPLDDADEMEATIVTKRNDAKIRWIEKFATIQSGCHLSLDMDAWKERVDSAQILPVADTLHDLIYSEFNSFATDELRTYMRSKNGKSP